MTKTLLRSLVLSGRWAALGLVCGCASPGSSGGDDASDDPCVPGESVACECDDGEPGARVCEPDGVGFGECSCVGDDGSSGSSISASSNPSDPSNPSNPSDASAESDSAESAESSPATDPTDGTDDGSETADYIPTFQVDIVPLLNAGCGANNSLCHARNAYFPNADQGCRGWGSFENVPLGSSFDDLDPETNGPPEGTVPGCMDLSAYDRLMQLAPWECDASSAYVTPGSLEQSYIFVKLTNGATCGDFRVMPPVGEGYEFPQEAVDTLAAWILAGAPE